MTKPKRKPSNTSGHSKKPGHKSSTQGTSMDLPDRTRSESAQAMTAFAPSYPEVPGQYYDNSQHIQGNTRAQGSFNEASSTYPGQFYSQAIEDAGGDMGDHEAHLRSIERQRNPPPQATFNTGPLQSNTVDADWYKRNSSLGRHADQFRQSTPLAHTQRQTSTEHTISSSGGVFQQAHANPIKQRTPPAIESENDPKRAHIGDSTQGPLGGYSASGRSSSRGRAEQYDHPSYQQHDPVRESSGSGAQRHHSAGVPPLGASSDQDNPHHLYHGKVVYNPSADSKDSPFMLKEEETHAMLKKMIGAKTSQFRIQREVDKNPAVFAAGCVMLRDHAFGSGHQLFLVCWARFMPSQAKISTFTTFRWTTKHKVGGVSKDLGAIFVEEARKTKTWIKIGDYRFYLEIVKTSFKNLDPRDSHIMEDPQLRMDRLFDTRQLVRDTQAPIAMGLYPNIDLASRDPESPVSDPNITVSPPSRYARVTLEAAEQESILRCLRGYLTEGQFLYQSKKILLNERCGVSLHCEKFRDTTFGNGKQLYLVLWLRTLQAKFDDIYHKFNWTGVKGSRRKTAREDFIQKGARTDVWFDIRGYQFYFEIVKADVADDLCRDHEMASKADSLFFNLQRIGDGDVIF